MKNTRFNIYTAIHKGMRASLSQVLLDLGRLDDTDTDMVTRQLQVTEELLGFCHRHLQHENQFIHPVLERFQVQAIASAKDHEQHEIDIKKLLAEIELIKKLPALRRRQVLLDLYRNFSLFVAENLIHMQQEETVNAELMWEHLSDSQIHEIHAALIASLPPEQNMQSLTMILPNVTHDERLEILQGVAQGAGAEVASMLVSMLKTLVNTHEWNKLSRAMATPQTVMGAAFQ